VAHRPELRPRAPELYEGQLRLQILPALGEPELGTISASRARAGRTATIAAGKPGVSTVAECYRLVHAIFATAVEDDVVVRNPCVIKGAAAKRPAERSDRHPPGDALHRLAACDEGDRRQAGSASTTCGTRATRWRRRRAPAPRS
jgi:hypothetical protein